jgi:hypothetical protein
MNLRNFGILPHQYTTSQSEDGNIIVPRNFGILPHHCMASQPEDGGSIVLRSVGIIHLSTRCDVAS